jgi:CHAT domain
VYSPPIIVRQPRDTSVLWFTSAGSRRPFLVVKAPTADAMTQARMSIRGALDEVRRATSDHLQLSWPEAEAAFHHLYKAGAAITYQLFGVTGKALQVSQFFGDGWPGWKGFRGPFPVLQVEVPHNAMYPFEIMPLFDLTKPPARITDYLTLAEVARRFAGFSMVVRRLVARTPMGKNSVQIPRPLRISFLQNANLDGAKKELAFFADADPAAIHLEGPWPTATTGTAELAGAMFDPDAGFADWPQSTPREIVHFACHCETRAQSGSDYTLRLQGDDGKQLYLRLMDLQIEYLARAAAQGSAGSFTRPFVFINACGSSHVEPITGTSLHAFLLGERHSGVIGTETEIGDDLAAEVSGHFYRRLLAGDDMGEALQRAKWMLLKRYRNPLGLLYTMYGDTRLQVAPPSATS